MRIIDVGHRTVRWSIDPRGAARGTTQREAVIIDVRDESGLVGLGEAAPLLGMSIDTLDDAIAAANVLAACVPFEIHAASDASALADRLTTAPAARFAIETALLTLLAQAQRTSVASLLAAMPQAELEHAVVVDTDEEARLATARCLKIKVGPTGDIERVRRIAVAAPGKRLRLDANRRWSRAETPAIIESLRDLPIDYIEEPCPHANELLDARERPSVIDLSSSAAPAHRIALDESLIDLDRASLLRALSSPQLAALVLKPTLLGGFARCLELAKLAHEHGVAPIVTHTLEGPVGFAACIELARAIAADVPVGLARPAAPRTTTNTHAETISNTHVCTPGISNTYVRMAQSNTHVGTPSISNTHVGTASISNTHVGMASISNTHGGIAQSNTHVGTAPPANTHVGTAPPANTHASTASSSNTPVGLRATVIIATHSESSVDAIRTAWREHQPIALLHAKAAPAELARQRHLVETADLRDDDALILFTSGSTGPARGVIHTRASVEAAARASEAHLGWRDGDAWLCCLPLAHAGGASIILRCLLANKRVVLADDPRAIDHATLASLVPTQLASLLDDTAWRPSPKLRAVLLGGAATPRALLDRALERGVPVLSTYGLTETFGQVATARAPGQLPAPLDGITITGGTADRPALLRITSPSLASRYLDGEPIAPTFATADLGFVDDGVHVLGRADDVIITGGENVHPAQVEAVLARTSGVREAVAFGVADPRWGQVVAAAIARTPEWNRDAALDEWHARLPPHARPRRLVELDSLPRLPSGKVDRRSLAALPSSSIEYR